MKVLVTGTKEWSDYNELIRNLSIIVEDWVKSNPDDKKLTFVHTASSPVENMVTEYVGKVESFAKQKGYKITEKLYNVHKKNNEKITEIEFIMMNSGIDMVISFNKGKSKKIESMLDILSEYGIPVYTVDHHK